MGSSFPFSRFALSQCSIPRISWELVACHDKLGEFAIDDNEGLTDPALTRFILEVRDATIPPLERRFLPNKGWKQVDHERVPRVAGIRWGDREVTNLR